MDEYSETYWDEDVALNDQFDHLPFKEYPNKSKFLRENPYWLSEDDVNLEFGRDYTDDTPLDNFDGRLDVDQISNQDNMFPFTRRSTQDLLNYSDLYDEYEMAVMAKVARLKVAHINIGDTVLLMRPQRYDLSRNIKNRLARVIDTQDNGWLLVETARGDKVAVYCGSTSIDDDVQKIDFADLERVYPKKLKVVQKHDIGAEFLEENQHWAKVSKIVKRKGKFVVMSKDGSRSFGTYDTEEEAKKRLNQIHFFARKA